jgi:hypothetical protein
MRDWIVVHHTHTLTMLAADTAELCVRFLEAGSFDSPPERDVEPQAGSPTI